MSYNTGPKIVTDGLVLCLDAADRNSYPGTGSTWYDLSGRNNHVTLSSPSSDPTFNTNYGGCFSFDGGDMMTIGTNISDLNFGNQNFTIESWIYRNNTNQAVIAVGQANLATGPGSSFVFYTHSSAKSDVYIGSTGYGVNSPNPGVNTWSHIMMIRDSGTLKTILNKNTVDSRSDLGTGSLNTGYTNYPATIGRFATGINGLNGNISQIKIYHKALSAEEILQNYNATKGRFGL